VTAKTVTIDHPHAEVIAAYYSGKTVQSRVHFALEWVDHCIDQRDQNGTPVFFAYWEYRIKPEPLVRWVGVDGGPNNICYDNKEDAERTFESIRLRSRDARIVRMVEMPE
jgi:hypothetical protein